MVIATGIAGWDYLRSKPTSSTTQTDSSTSTTTTQQTNSATSTQPATTTPSGITLEQVASHDGKSGNTCWVAVDGTVYEISGFVQWVDGLHTPSGGRARCGKDLSTVINQSPHGRRVLQLLTVVGKLQS